MDEDTATYRRVIDQLVHDTLEGQGQLGATRIRRGVWNPNATRDLPPDQVAINELLARMPDAGRAVFASVVAEAFRGGMHQALVHLHEAGVRPFDKAYEGTPFHDYIGRLDGWQWPVRARR